MQLLVEQHRCVVQLHKLEILAGVVQVGPPYQGANANLEPGRALGAVQLADRLGNRADACAAGQPHVKLRHATEDP
eukprot:scaffold13947_cov108-Isochrysis_galbana.AAC.6